MSSTDQLYSLFEEFWVWRLHEAPEFATQVGYHNHDDKLDSYRLDDFHIRKNICVDYMNRAKVMEPFIIANADAVNLQMFLDELNTYETGYNYKGFLFPINYLEGVQHDFERLVGWMKFDTVNDYNKLLSRYAALSTQVDEIISLLEEGIQLGMTNHYVSMEGVVQQFDKLQIPAADSGIFSPFINFPDEIEDDTKKSLYDAGKQAYDNRVLPAFRKLRNFIADIIVKLSRPTSIKDFCNNLRSTRDFYYRNKPDLLKGFSDMVNNQIRPRLSTVIKNRPRMELEVKSLPTGSENAPACQYFAGSHDGTRPGVFYVNLMQYNTQPKYEMMSLCLHEGEPGHHTQAAFAIEKRMPSFRKFMEDRKYSDAPSRFPIHTAYVEGWALYAESLGDELGLYKDLYMKFGHLSEEIFRACRLVVDTGMHAFGWTQEMAIEYMKAHSSASEMNIVNEVRRYVTWPGQACAYKIGQMKISDLRTLAQKTLGKQFDVKEFHNVILSNGGPLLILERQVQKYIEKVNDTEG
uniref:DUF885 domain-containing protein n=1 Tax=Strigamia maritima TaxID=126957 RepID=T1JLB6_STRMM